MLALALALVLVLVGVLVVVSVLVLLIAWIRECRSLQHIVIPSKNVGKKPSMRGLISVVFVIVVVVVVVVVVRCLLFVAST